MWPQDAAQVVAGNGVPQIGTRPPLSRACSHGCSACERALRSSRCRVIERTSGRRGSGRSTTRRTARGAREAAQWPTAQAETSCPVWVPLAHENAHIRHEIMQETRLEVVRVLDKLARAIAKRLRAFALDRLPPCAYNHSPRAIPDPN